MEMASSSYMSNQVTKNVGTSASSISRQQQQQELVDVRDVLKGPPLTNRTILIPFGSKAFLPGTLQPLLSIPTITSDEVEVNNRKINQLERLSQYALHAKQSIDEVAKEHELVIVHPNAETVTTTDNTNNICTPINRNEAIQSLQQKINKLLNKSIPTAITSTTQVATTKSTSKSVASVAEKAKSIVSELPYIEIREELDEHGNVITSEAKNVTNHIQYLQSQSQTERTKDNIPASKLNNVDIVRNDSDDNDTTNQQHEAEQQQQHTVTDEEYSSISKRLEELILLEEQQGEQQQQYISPTVPKKSSSKKDSHTSSNNKKLGWSKGFLNTSSKSNKLNASTTTVDTNRKLEQKNVDESPITNTTSNTSTFSDNSKKSNNTSKKVVSFTENDNSVQIIPRIGQRSISSTIQPPPSSLLSSVTSPQVIEKKQNSRRRTSSASGGSTSGSSVNTPTPTTTTTTGAPPTKLSRFAQERLLLRQNQQPQRE